MKTYLDCIPCFFRQALEAARMVTNDPKKQKEVIDEIARIIPDLSFDASPPEMGHIIYNTAKKAANHTDPYKHLKALYNQKALSLYPKLKQEINNAPDPLVHAIRLAIAGNIIDFGPNVRFDLTQELEESRTRPFAIFDYDAFQKILKETAEILYLGDNAGEIVFDKLLIETLKKPTLYVVRGEPIINDVTMKDAKEVGLDKVAKVISNGSGAPGTVLRLCSEEFHHHFRKAKLIIAKGQGNYETLSEEKMPIFFMLKVKCPVIAQHLNVEVGDIVFKGNVNT
jgi:uncharacterized protein with ATP-grasp and redox domains